VLQPPVDSNSKKIDMVNVIDLVLNTASRIFLEAAKCIDIVSLGQWEILKFE
jgi:hypothetical protein